MSLHKEQIIHSEIDNPNIPKPRAGARKWLKNQMNRFLRRMPVPEMEDYSEEESAVQIQPQKVGKKPNRG